MHKKLFSLVLAIGAAASLAPAESARGQERTPALVAIQPRLQGETDQFRIARFAGASPRYVILLAPGADAAVFTRAVQALRSTQRAADPRGSDAMLRMRHAPRSGPRQPGPILPWADRVLQDVRAAAPRHVPGVGSVRAVRIWLPVAGHAGGA